MEKLKLVMVQIKKIGKWPWFRIFRYCLALLLSWICIPLIVGGASNILSPKIVGYSRWPEVVAYGLQVAGWLILFTLLIYFVLSLLKTDRD